MRLDPDTRRKVLAACDVGKGRRRATADRLAWSALVAEVTVPIRLKSRANLREHWAVGWERNRREKVLVANHFNLYHLAPESFGRPVLVTLTRLGGRPFDGDNLQAAFKAIRDEVAAFLEADDGDEAVVRWAYGQEPGKWHGVRIRLECPLRRAESPLFSGV